MAINERRKKIAWCFIYLLWIFADVEIFWGWDSRHLVFLLAASAGTIALLFAEFERASIIWGSLATVITALAVYDFAPPTPVPESEFIGMLAPGDDPTPPNPCDDISASVISTPSNTLRVLIGNNAVAKIGSGKFTVFQIGRCPVLSMERTPTGVAVSAEIFDATGKLVARIANGRFDVLTGESIRASRGGDLTTLSITTNFGDELLYIRYLNETTIRVRGIFSCPGYAPVTIKDGAPIEGEMMENSCTGIIGDGPGTGIEIQ